MNFKIITLLLFSLTFSCKAQVNLNKENEFISETAQSKSIIKLMPNYRFEYSNKEKLADQISKGTWKSDGQHITLTSDDDYKSGIIEFHEYEKNSSKTEIIVFDPDDNYLINAGVTVNDNENVGWNIDENGLVSFTKKEIKKITIYYLGQKYTYQVNNLNANRFVLKVRIDDLSFKYFYQEKFSLKENSLISKDDQEFILVNGNGID